MVPMDPDGPLHFAPTMKAARKRRVTMPIWQSTLQGFANTALGWRLRRQTCQMRCDALSGVGEGGASPTFIQHTGICQRGVGACDGGPCRSGAFLTAGEGGGVTRRRLMLAWTLSTRRRWPTRCGRLRLRPINMRRLAKRQRQARRGVWPRSTHRRWPSRCGRL